MRLTVQLKQHTPLIHFQWQQEGATLRASEVKPKLDRFILKKLGQGDEKKGFDFAKKQHWCVGKQEHPALSYKMKIIVSEVSCEPIEQSYERTNGRRATATNPLFFANMGEANRENKKCFVRGENIKIEFLFQTKSLLEKVKELLPDFFASTNFGTRQDKGFGSYYIAEGDDLYKDISTVLPQGTSYITIPSVDEKIIWAAIDYYYRRLKSGIHRVNINGRSREGTYPYKKSFLRINHPDVHWEKECFKIAFLGGDEIEDEKEFVFLRAILGLPGSYTFREGNLDRYGRKVVEDEYEIEVRNEFVERIPSPITFKVIKDENESRIFLLVEELDNDTYNEIKNHGFEFVAKFKFIHWKFDENSGERIRNQRREFQKISTYISMEKAYSDIDNRLLRNSVSPEQTERLKDFLDRCHDDETIIELSLPEEQISIRELLEAYHLDLNYSYDVKYKDQPQDRDYQNITANIDNI